MSNPFDATASMLGYLFQCRLALVDALRRLRYQGSFTVSLETLEDVAFEAEGQPKELLQTKHHVSRSASISDASPDLWKTIRVWAEGFTQNRWDSDTIHYLATTETANSSSLAYLLRQRSRDEVKARERLDHVARTSENADNRVCYEAYLNLSGDERLSLVQRIVILDRTPTVDLLDTLLRQELTTTVRREQLLSLIHI